MHTGMRMRYVPRRRGYSTTHVAMAEKEGNVLQTFWGLSSLDAKERGESARDLLAALTDAQVQLSSSRAAKVTSTVIPKITEY